LLTTDGWLFHGSSCIFSHPIMHISASFIKVSHPSLYHWSTHGMFSIHLTKLMMNVSRCHVSCIQETDYRPHFTCGRLFSFLEHCKHTGPYINVVWLSANGIRAFPKDQQTLHAWALSWVQRCNGNICKHNLFCGYDLYVLQSLIYILSNYGRFQRMTCMLQVLLQTRENYPGT
jgi:hypothetical protein